MVTLDLQVIIKPDTLVLPGHGDDTTIGADLDDSIGKQTNALESEIMSEQAQRSLDGKKCVVCLREIDSETALLMAKHLSLQPGHGGVARMLKRVLKFGGGLGRATRHVEVLRAALAQLE